MSRTRVLVVEDSLTVRRFLVDVLEGDPDLEVVGEAEDGRAGVELCASLRPDVITLDLALPRMNGLEVTEHVMAYHPTPILIVSSSYNRGEMLRTLDALAAGAVDVLEKPDVDECLDAWKGRFLSTVKLVARIRVITHLKGRLPTTAIPLPPRVPPADLSSEGSYRLVAIGASTGGPGALAQILQGLPSSYPLPVVVVMHINAPFGDVLADWLDRQSSLPVRTITDGQALPPVGQGMVLLAPAERHVEVRGERLYLTSGPPRHFCCPSVDVMFESVAASHGPRAIGLLLTGMGRDGAAGLADMRARGAVTVAQDEASCVVFGMPKEAIALGAAQRVLPLGEMRPLLIRLAAGCGDAGRKP